jgi:hypothetical protein
MNADEAWASYAGISVDDDETFRVNRALREAVEATAREVALDVFLHGVAEIERAKADNPPAVAGMRVVTNEAVPPGEMLVTDGRTGVKVTGIAPERGNTDPGGVRVEWTEEEVRAAWNLGRGNSNTGGTDGSGTRDVRRDRSDVAGRGVHRVSGGGADGGRDCPADPVSGTTTPGGVRVEWDDHGGPPWVTVDRETLIAALDDYEDILTQFGYRADRAEARKALAARLGIHLKGED